jgi:voltage-gated potassium channel
MMKALCNSLPKLAGTYIALIVVSAVLFSLFEGRDIFESIYWAGTTATSTGYGDISPQTLPGRMLAFAVMHLAIFFIAPMIVVRLITQLIEDRNEFTHEEQEDLKRELREVKAMLKQARDAVCGEDKREDSTT